jgi:hypothetical protein
MRIPTRKARSLWFRPPETTLKNADPEPKDVQNA